MTEKILINVSLRETRVAVLDNGVVQDIHVERRASRGIVGNIYAGKVVRVLPGMQAAFVDFGAERKGLVRVSDLAGKTAGKQRRVERHEPAIESRLHDGQKVVVQVARNPLGSKGARLTTELSLSSRLLVYLPRASQLVVSQRIDSSGERARLLLLLQEGMEAEGLAGQGGYILRTAAEGVGLDELRADLRFLQRLWTSIRRRSQEAVKPQLLYADLPLHLRVARDLAGPEVESVLIDNHPGFLELCAFCEEYVPELSGRLDYYKGAASLFDESGAEAEIQCALSRRVELDCGGYLVIDQTEAMTTIDVNTGSFIGRRNLQETIFKTNLEAARALARQLRLRKLGGIIIVDFIDMTDQELRRQLLLELQEALQRDPVRTTFNGMSELGLVVMNRKRTGESLQHILCEDCPVCRGAGVVKSARSVCYEIFREIDRLAPVDTAVELLVLAAQPVVDLLQGEESAGLAELAADSGKTIRLRAETMYNQEHFDIAML